MTAAQGRVLFHLERLFRSTGAGVREHGVYLAAVRGAGLNPEGVAHWSTADCVRALRLMEKMAAPMAKFRDVRTGWRDFSAPGVHVPPSPEWVAGGHPGLIEEAHRFIEQHPFLALT